MSDEAKRWIACQSLPEVHAEGCVARLPNGKVLLAGGRDPRGMPTTNCYLYDPYQDQWETTGALPHARINHAMTLLGDGSVLVAGGRDANNLVLASAAIYDVDGGTWTTATPLGEAREHLSLTLLEGGNVLAFGGQAALHAELYDASTKTWSQTGERIFRCWHAVARLDDGKVLIAGGYPSTEETLLFDPIAKSWTRKKKMFAARNQHVGVLLADGRLFVAGGYTDTTLLASAEVYDPAKDEWTQLPDMPRARGWANADLLRDGRVLITGGRRAGSDVPENTADIFDPADRSWTSVAETMATPRLRHASTRIPRGRIVVIGGEARPGHPTNHVESYEPERGVWRVSGPLVLRWDKPSAVALKDGGVLLLGGTVYGHPVADAERWDPERGVWRPTGKLHHAGHTRGSIMLPGGRILVVGGAIGMTLLETAEIYDPKKGLFTLLKSRLNPGVFVGNNMALLDEEQILIVGLPILKPFPGTLSWLFDSEKFMFTRVGSFTVPSSHGWSIVALPDGRALAVGGMRDNGPAFGPQIFDPRARRWSPSPAEPNRNRPYVKLVRLKRGRVLALGGFPDYKSQEVDLFDSVEMKWTKAAPMLVPRQNYAVSSLADGSVMVTGGNLPYERRTDRYDPERDRWEQLASTKLQHENHIQLLLADGRVMIVGGTMPDEIGTCEVYET